MGSIAEVSQALLDCVCGALADIGRPTCACYATVGTPMIGLPVSCCECEPGISGELTIHLDRLYEVDPSTLQSVNRVRPCKRGAVAADFVLILTRCYPTIDEEGNAPSPDDLEEAAHNLHDDAATVWHALSCCPDQTLRIIEVGVESDPQAGCSTLTARVAAEVSPRPPVVVS